ncbi:MAG TPA: hypothetical protein VK922_10365 [Gemmatimonadaceae bacterium]|nr:hypothetical protein [Gemmatimonadaceae bacterium]
MLTDPASRPSWRGEYGGPWQIELGLLALVLAAASFIAPLADPDLPMHLAIGEWIVRHGTVPTVEPFAWTRAGEPYYAYSWLPEVGFFAAYRAAGVMGVQVLQGLGVLATLLSLAVLARLARWSVWTAVVLAASYAVTAMSLAPYLRPHLVLIAAVPLAWGCALRLVESDRPWRWASGIFMLSALSANSHLLFPVIAAPWLLLALRWPGSGRAAWLVGATMAGWLLTPYAFDWPAVFALNFNDNVLFTYPTPIGELTPGVQAAVNGRGVLLVMTVVFALLPWLATRLTTRERIIWGAAWLAGFLAFALAVRAFLVWWLLLLPMVGGLVDGIARLPRRREILLAQRIAVGALVLLLAFARASIAGAPWAEDTGAARWIPRRAAPWVDPVARWLDCRMRDEASGRAMTAFPLGTYLTWHYPRLSYSIDSRNIFPDSVAAAEGYVLASERRLALGPWRSADVAIVPFRYPVASALDTADDWRRAVMVVDRGEWSDSDSLGLWIREAWWLAASDSLLPDPPMRLRMGREGVEEACH